MSQCGCGKQLAIAVFATAALAFGSIAIASEPRDTHVERLASLAKIWATIKYFHPRMGYNGIDWDRALVDAIPRVNAARSDDDAVDAINSMISAIGDPGTLVYRVHQPPVATEEPATAAAIVLTQSVLRIDLQGESQSGRPFETTLATVDNLASDAKIVVLDLRGHAMMSSDAEERASELLTQILPKLLSKDLVLASNRHRLYNGYPPQKGTSSGGFYSGWVVQNPSIISAETRSSTPKLVVLVDESSIALDVVMGLQSSGLAFVIQEGSAPRYTDRTLIEVGDDVVLQMSASEPIDAHGGRFQADQVATPGQWDEAVRRAVAMDGHWPDSRRTDAQATPRPAEPDRSYPEMAFPSYEYRLLALFRYWSVIDFFYPYKSLIGSAWDDVLRRYIPVFEAQASELDYETSLRKLSVEIHDSHGFLGPTKAFAEKVGLFTPPIALRYVQDESVVAAVFDPALPIRVGDILVSVDGRSAESMREYFASLYSSSTPQASMRFVEPFLLRGGKDSVAKLTLRGIDGRLREVDAVRSMGSNAPEVLNAFNRSGEIYKVLPSGIGYVDLARLQMDGVDHAFDVIRGTRAAIFDMRGYPNGTAWSVAPRLARDRNPVAALFSQPLLEGTTVGSVDTGASIYQFQQRLPDAAGDHYSGKVVVLIDDLTVSQAEHTCLFLEAATDAVFVGTPTSGVDGDTTNLVLPGGITAYFSGDAVRHADGRQLQRVGIQPTRIVSPTIAGLAAGRDEILDAAISFLELTK